MPTRPQTRPRPTPADDAASKGPRFELRREAFIDAATEIMNRDGAQGMTLADVAGRLGMTTPSIRYYFKRKEDLAVACLLRAIDQIDELIIAADQAQGAAAKVSRFISLYFEHLRLIRIGEARPIAHFSDVRAFESQNSAPVIEGYARMFRRLRHFLRNDELAWMDRNTRQARAFLLTAMLLWAPAWTVKFEPYDHAELAKRVADIILGGLAPTSGAAWRPALIATEALVDPPTKATGPMDTFLIAATQLINEQGYRGASIEKIAARLNVTKGSFYHYHQAKDDLVVSCFKRTYDIVARAQRASIDATATGWDSLTTASAALTDFQFSPLGPLLLNGALSVLPHSVAADMLSDWGRVSTKFAMMVSSGIVDGSVRPVDVVVASELIHAAVNSTAQLALWANIATIEDPKAFYLQPLFFGLLSPLR